VRKVLKWLGIVLGVVAGLLVAAVIALYALSEARLGRTYDVPPVAVTVPTDAASIARGEHLATVLFQCGSCHGEDLSGGVLFEDPLTGRLAPSNLTPGQGGAGRTYSDEDWAVAIRHGVLPNGKAGIAMSSNIFWHINDADLGAMIAYLKSLPPVDKEVPPTQLGLMGRVFVLQAPDVLPASMIDHQAPRPPDVPPGVTAEYGQYLAHICTVCHGENYAGQAGEEGAGNLTPAGNIANWTEAEFMRTLRTGTTPEGKALDPEFMPWPTLGKMSDDELRAVWLFLQTLPPAAPAPAPG
jgi:mono/diheme cytochrome c family protein